MCLPSKISQTWSYSLAIDYHLIMFSSGAHHASGIPDVNTIAPRNLQNDFWRPVHVWLHIFIVLFLARDCRPEIAQDRRAKILGNLQLPGDIDDPSVDYFPRAWILLLRLLELVKDGVIL